MSRTIRCRPTARNATALSPRGRRCPPNRHSQWYHWELLLDPAFWPGSFFGWRRMAGFDRLLPILPGTGRGTTAGGGGARAEPRSDQRPARKRSVWGKRVAGRLGHGGWLIITKKNKPK